VPLFGTVILGMLWKRATPAGGFWGFVTAILVSMGMWGFVHSFPDGYRPQPKLTLGAGAVVALEQSGGRVTGLAVQQGTVDAVNVPMPPGAPSFVVPDGGLTLPGSVPAQPHRRSR